MQKILSDEDKEYLAALKKKRLAMLNEAKTYSTRTRARTLYDISLKELNDEIARLEGTTTPRFRRVVVTDR